MNKLKCCHKCEPEWRHDGHSHSDEWIMHQSDECTNESCECHTAKTSSLQNLQAETQDVFVNAMIAFEETCPESNKAQERPLKMLQLLRINNAHVYEMALQEALGKVPGEKPHTKGCKAWHARDCTCKVPGHNQCRTETIQGIKSLITNNEV